MKTSKKKIEKKIHKTFRKMHDENLYFPEKKTLSRWNNLVKTFYLVQNVLNMYLIESADDWNEPLSR